MCGNDISTVVNPTSQSFLQQLRVQIASGKVSIKNNHQGIKQQISKTEIELFQKFDTTKLLEIQLIRCSITHQLLESLLNNDWRNLRILNLNNNRIGPIGCQLIASANLQNLKSLQLSNNKIKDNGLRSLITTTKFLDLEDLNLTNNALTNQGIKSLKVFSSIEYLSIGENNLNDQSAEIIKSINDNGNGLVYLGLSKNQFTNQSLRQFLNMESLSVLLIDRNKVTMPKTQLPNNNQLFVFY